MPEPSFQSPAEQSQSDLDALVRRLRDDSAKKEISPKNYAHRLRVIRQQTKLLAHQLRGTGMIATSRCGVQWAQRPATYSSCP
jgi:hypothetical protein